MKTQQKLVYNEINDEIDGYVIFDGQKEPVVASMVGCYYLRCMRSGQEIPLYYNLTLNDDQSGTNTLAFNKLGVLKDKPSFKDKEGNIVYAFHDYTHLVARIKNYLLSKM